MRPPGPWAEGATGGPATLPPPTDETGTGADTGTGAGTGASAGAGTGAGTGAANGTPTAEPSGPPAADDGDATGRTPTVRPTGPATVEDADATNRTATAKPTGPATIRDTAATNRTATAKPRPATADNQKATNHTVTAKPTRHATIRDTAATNRATTAKPRPATADNQKATNHTVTAKPTRHATIRDTAATDRTTTAKPRPATADNQKATNLRVTAKPTCPEPGPATGPAIGPAPGPAPGPAAGPAAADGGDPPQGPPAPGVDARTGGAGGRQVTAEGGAEADRTLRRTEGLLLGLAAGDAAGWPAARHRAARMPEWTRRLTRELDTFAEQNATTTLPVPIALNQPPEPLRLGPSDDAEWAAFAAEAVLRAGDDSVLGDLGRQRRMRAAIDLTWNAVAAEVAAAADRAPEVESAVLPLRARISVRAGLGNLATGLRPPATGHDNPHFFDDAACIRACVLAVAHPGDPRLAAELAEFDARYTQDGDGVHGARAMAAALSLALAGADTGACVAAALTELPEGTEIGRNARHALALARTTQSAFALVPLLEHQIVDHVYSYGVAAAETVPVALALATASGGRIAEAVPAAACLSRVADSAPALAGALTGALGGAASIPVTWRDACRTLSGCALPRLTGTDLVELAELLEAAQPAATGG